MAAASGASHRRDLAVAALLALVRRVVDQLIGAVDDASPGIGPGDEVREQRLAVFVLGDFLERVGGSAADARICLLRVGKFADEPLHRDGQPVIPVFVEHIGDLGHKRSGRQHVEIQKSADWVAEKYSSAYVASAKDRLTWLSTVNALVVHASIYPPEVGQTVQRSQPTAGRRG